VRLCVVVKEDIVRCPPLVRLINALCVDGYSVDVFCVGGTRQVPSLTSEGDCHGQVQIRRAVSVGSKLRVVRPFLETWFLSKQLTPAAWDLAVAYDPYALLAATRSPALKRTPIVYYSAELWDFPRWILQRLSEHVSRNRVAGLITCQKDRESILRTRWGFDGPCIVVPNSCFDYRDELATCRQCKELPMSPVWFCYMGGLQPHERCLYELVEVFGNRIQGARLKMIVRGTRKKLRQFKRLIDGTRNPESIKLLSFITYPEHFHEAYISHVGVMLYRNVSLNYRYCAPNKLYEYAMLGKPVLCSDQDHLREEVEGHNLGICVDPSDVDQIEAAVRHMCGNLDLRSLGAQERQWYLHHGRYEVHYRRLRDFFLQIACVDARP